MKKNHSRISPSFPAKLFLLITVIFIISSCTTYRHDIVKTDRITKNDVIGIYIANDALNKYNYDIIRFFVDKGYKVDRIQYLPEINQSKSIGITTVDIAKAQQYKSFITALGELEKEGIKYLIVFESDGNLFYSEVWDAGKKAVIFSQAFRTRFFACSDRYLKYTLMYLDIFEKNITNDKILTEKTRKAIAKTSSQETQTAGSEVKEISTTGCISGNCKSGTGVFVANDGVKYQGQFKDGKFHGKGTYTWPDGKKYVGDFSNGTYHGYGMYMDSDGTILKNGVYENGKFVK